MKFVSKTIREAATLRSLLSVGIMAGGGLLRLIFLWMLLFVDVLERRLLLPVVAVLVGQLEWLKVERVEGADTSAGVLFQFIAAMAVLFEKFLQLLAFLLLRNGEIPPRSEAIAQHHFCAATSAA